MDEKVNLQRNGPKTRIKQALEHVNRQISDMARQSGRYAGGLASEGYAGGYAAALSDVLLVLNKCPPCVRPEYWNNHEG